MKPEQKLYHLFKKNLNKDTLITRLEVYSAHGVSDLLLYNNAGFCMVELKIQRGKKISFSPHQVLFHTPRSKRNFILVNQARKGGQPSVILYGANSIDKLIIGIDKAVPLAVNDWQLIQKIIGDF